MASPQCENGYTRLANELLEALAKIRIPGEARQVFDTILRKTYGYGKKEDTISLSQFVLSTSLLKNHICDSVKKLKQMNLITEKGNGIPNVYSINKDYTSWKPLPKKVTLPKKVISITEKGNKSLPKKVHTIDIIQKKLIQKKLYSPNSEEFRLSTLLLNLILERRGNYKKPNLQNWCLSIDKMINVDKRDTQEIEKTINWCQADAFWQNNILSTSKLREQYDQLALKMLQNKIPIKNKAEVLMDQNIQAGKDFINLMKKESEGLF